MGRDRAMDTSPRRSALRRLHLAAHRWDAQFAVVEKWRPGSRDAVRLERGYPHDNDCRV
jgi:hypothetical protein